MRISVIIPAFNEERLLGETLGSIKAASTAFAQRQWDWELIVCDNNSSDRTAEVAREAGAVVVFEPVNQIARARNSGAALARGEWLVFVDADSHPSERLFDAVARQIQSGRCLAGGAVVAMATHRRGARWLTGVWNALSRWGRLMAGSFIFVDAAAFREVGGFSEKLFAGEELDLSRKLKGLARRQGRKVVILNQHPLLTSGRKLELYSRRELVGFFLRAAFARRRVLQSRAACHPWYDGRR
jgi:GT2 family glycosyltransferase